MARRTRPILTLLLAGAALSLPAPTAGADDRPRLPSWEKLELEARKLLITARTSLTVRSEPGVEAATSWVAVDDPRPVPPAVVRLTSRASMLGRTSVNTVWIDPATFAAQQRLLREDGSRTRRKVYRYGRRSVLALRSEPETAAERELPEPDWTRRSRQEIELDGRAVVTDPMAIFYLLSMADPRRLQQGIEIDVLTSNAISTVRIVEVGPEQIRTESKLVRNGEVIRDGSRHTVTARVFAVTPPEGAEEFELLGLEGAVEIAMDAEHGVPLEIRGRIPPVGGVTVRLLEATMR